MKGRISGGASNPYEQSAFLQETFRGLRLPLLDVWWQQVISEVVREVAAWCSGRPESITRPLGGACPTPTSLDFSTLNDVRPKLEALKFPGCPAH